MTIEDGSSLSQSKTHLEVFENLVESDCTMLREPAYPAHGKARLPYQGNALQMG